MTIHVTLLFVCILVILFVIFQSKEIKARSVAVICFLLIIIVILGPETLLIYICCTSDDVRLIIGVVFIIELIITISILLILIHLRNERLRSKN